MKTFGLCFALLLCNGLLFAQQKHYLVTGTYTGTGSYGVYVYRFNPVNGTAQVVDSVAASNPSYLAVAPGGNFIYVVNEDADSTKPGGGVSAFAFNRRTGKLRFLNKVSSGGNHPCYIAVHPNGKWVVAGNYSSGDFSILRINANGSLQPLQQLVKHSGNSINTERQNSAHVHATVFGSDSRRLYVTDLGTDQLKCYPFNAANGRVNPQQCQTVKTDAGGGPRHIAFHPSNKFLYLMQELSGSVAVYRMQKNGLREVQQLFAYPPSYRGPVSSADIHVSPDGKFLYCSNRTLSNTIAIFRINPATGEIRLVGHEYTQGEKPRNFNFDPTGKYLLVANQETNEVVIFRRNTTTGLLTDTGNRIAVPKPVCLQWINISGK